MKELQLFILKRAKLCFLLLMFGRLSAALYARDIEVRGKLVDEHGELYYDYRENINRADVKNADALKVTFSNFYLWFAQFQRRNNINRQLILALGID